MGEADSRPKQKKPDDWDEDAPMEILDEDATKPEGWLDDEPEEIEDPDADEPEDWDEEEDGEWEAPMVRTSARKRQSAVSGSNR